ncbi:unnamed protein product [Notodromas monacha]|uniref:BTB domain-containing protein n=1 Tax=Notodromas monacha TaxID=399045 RepID=A0A7R9BS32_9CRUS|nr:unnamed protein product [Notodromas monacha]CAG0919737.1 unnamed protein product [Notodromas monacha]
MINLGVPAGASPVVMANSSQASNGTHLFKLNWMQWAELGDRWDIFDSRMSYCDVSLVCGDGFLLAHSCMLSLDSFFIKNLLKEVTPGALGGNAGVVIHLPDWPKSVVRQLLSILYNGCAYLGSATESAEVSKLGRALGYNVHKWQLLPNTVTDHTGSSSPIPSPIKNLAASGTTISVLKRPPPPGLHHVSTFQGSKLTKYFTDEMSRNSSKQQLMNRPNGGETLAETSSVTISRIPCAGQAGPPKLVPKPNLIASSASAGCQTVSLPPKDPLAVSPGASHPAVPMIRVKPNLKMVPGLANRLDIESTVTLSGSPPPGLCKISNTSTSTSGVTANSRPLQEILSSCGRVLSVRNTNNSSAGHQPSISGQQQNPTRILLPSVVNKSTMISDQPRTITPKPVTITRSLLSSPPRLTVSPLSIQPSKPTKPTAEDDDEPLSIDSMLDCMIKEETLDDEEDLIDDDEDDNNAVDNNVVPVKRAAVPPVQPADEPPALIVHPNSSQTGSKVAWNHPDPGGWKGKDVNSTKNSPKESTPVSNDGNKETKVVRKRGPKRRRLSRKRRPIRIKIKTLKAAEAAEANGDEPKRVDGEEKKKENNEEEQDSDSEEEQNDDSDEDWELNTAGAKLKRKKSTERRSPRLSKGTKDTDKDLGKDDLQLDDVEDTSDEESTGNDDECNANVAFQRYCAEKFACMKMIRRHLLQGHGDKFPVHEITYSCGAIKRKRGDTNPAQSCPAMLHCKFNATWKKYVIAKLEQNHLNHVVTRDAYDVYMKKKELTSHEKKVALRLLSNGKDPETVCKIMNRVTGKTISVEYLTTLNF